MCHQMSCVIMYVMCHHFCHVSSNVMCHHICYVSSCVSCDHFTKTYIHRIHCTSSSQMYAIANSMYCHPGNMESYVPHFPTMAPPANRTLTGCMQGASIDILATWRVMCHISLQWLPRQTIHWQVVCRQHVLTSCQHRTLMGNKGMWHQPPPFNISLTTTDYLQNQLRLRSCDRPCKKVMWQAEQQGHVTVRDTKSSDR